MRWPCWCTAEVHMLQCKKEKAATNSLKFSPSKLGLWAKEQVLAQACALSVRPGDQESGAALQCAESQMPAWQPCPRCQLTGKCLAVEALGVHLGAGMPSMP